MPHQCVRCSRIIPTGSKEIIEGCANCKSRFFFYIREDQFEKLKQKKFDMEIPEADRQRIEKEVREIAGIEESDAPVILDFESVRVTGAGKFELDITNLFQKERPLVYRLEEGKYIIDLATSLGNRREMQEDEKK
jgi:predicted  nucleic acid-binding Zn-ribbon protein